MSKPLDILAFEPYHGGLRRAMLEAITRCSRHRWTLLKLPARKMERRLLVAATWFAEHLSRNVAGRLDVLFTSEALNLADLYRLRPELSKAPSVVYFHDNQMPDAESERKDTPTDLANLNTAMAASEIWFNSIYNLRTFLSRASGMVARHPELQSRNPMAGLTAKAHLMPPPIDLGDLHDVTSTDTREKDVTALLVDARGADGEILAAAINRLAKRKERMSVTVIGRLKGLLPSVEAVHLRERDEAGHLQAVLAAGVVIGARANATSDDLTIRALAAGCYPVFPMTGVYPELLPEVMHKHCLHDGTADSISDRILDAWYLERPMGMHVQTDEILARFDAIKACKAMDERLEMLAAGRRVKA